MKITFAKSITSILLLTLMAAVWAQTPTPELGSGGPGDPGPGGPGLGAPGGPGFGGPGGPGGPGSPPPTNAIPRTMMPPRRNTNVGGMFPTLRARTNANPAAVAAPAAQPTPAFPSFPKEGENAAPVFAGPPSGPGGTNAVPGGLPMTAGGIPISDPDRMVQAINWVNMTLEQVFLFYTELVERTILRSPTVPATAQISLKTYSALTKREAIQAIDYVLAMNNIAMIPMGEKFVLAVPSAQAMQEGMAFAVVEGNQLPEAAQYVTMIVHLTNALPSEVAPIIQPFGKLPASVTPLDGSQTLVIRDFAVNVKRMLEIIKKIDVSVESDYKLEVIPIRYGKVEDIYGVMSGLIGGSGGGGSTGTRATSSRRSGASGSRSGASGSRTGVGARGQMGLQGQGGQPNVAANPNAAQSAFQQRLQGIISKAAGGDSQILGDAKIIQDDRANSLVVYADKRDLAIITNLVDKLDVMLAQVLIEAVIIDVALNDSLTLGVSALQNPRTTGKFTGAGGMNNGQPFLSSITNIASSLPSGFSYFGKWAGDMDIAVSALAANDSSSVLQRPRIQTTHAVPASFFSGSTVPYITSTYGGGGYGGYSPSSQYSQLSVGIGLNVTPYITPDGLVVMEIEQNIDEISGAAKIGTDSVPTTSTRTANSTVSVRNGETIILGGFIRSSKTKSRSGVPLLKDIPLLGALFRSSSNGNERRELLVMLRPTVLHNPQDAAKAALDEKNRLPGVKKAEREFEALERAIMKESAADELKAEKKKKSK